MALAQVSKINCNMEEAKKRSDCCLMDNIASNRGVHQFALYYWKMFVKICPRTIVVQYFLNSGSKLTAELTSTRAIVKQIYDKLIRNDINLNLYYSKSSFRLDDEFYKRFKFLREEISKTTLEMEKLRASCPKMKALWSTISFISHELVPRRETEYKAWENSYEPVLNVCSYLRL